MKRDVKKFSLVSGVSLLMVLSMISVSAASYNYDSTVSDYVSSAYTKASNDEVSVSTKSFYLVGDHEDVYVLYNSGSSESYGEATAYDSLPSGGSKFTKVEAKHRVGSNHYSTFDLN